MIELDGIEYPVKTPDENTQDLISYVNTYCSDRGITNSLGEVIFIEVNITSPLYLLFWSIGYLATIIQKLLYSIGKQYSISASSEKQLLNIASNAGVRRLPATPTTVRALVTAKSTGTCYITTDLVATINYSGKTYRFSPIYAVNIAASQSAIIVLVAELGGALSLSAGAITQFDTDVENFDSMTSDASLPGRDQETIAALRRRLLARQNATSSIDKAVQALRSLPGVTACNIFYNTNSIDSVFIGTLEIPPRHTAIYIQGYSPDVAKTYFAYIDRPCVNTTGAIEQTITLENGQTFSVYMIPPVIRNAFVKVYTFEEISDAVKASIRTSIINVSVDIDVGSRLAQTQIIEKMLPEYKVIGVELCLTVDGDYGYSIKPEPNEVLTLSNDNISIEVAS